MGDCCQPSAFPCPARTPRRKMLCWLPGLSDFRESTSGWGE